MFWTALVAHLSSQPQPKEPVEISEKECKNSKLQRSVTATNLKKNIQHVHAFKRGRPGRNGRNAPQYGNSQKRCNLDRKLKWMSLIKHFLSCLWFLSDGRGGWGGWECPYNQCVNLNLTVFVQGEKNKKSNVKLLQKLQCHSPYHQVVQFIAGWQTGCQLVFSYARPGWELCWRDFLL